MDDTSYIPFVDWHRLVDIAVSDFRLSFMACAGMVIARTWGAVRIRKHRALPFISTPVWPVAFYWPLYVWGLEAPRSLVHQLFVGASYPLSHAAYESISVIGWNIIYASVLPLLLIAHIGAATQGLVNEFRCPGMPWQIALPFSVVVAVLGVYFMETAILVWAGTVALRLPQ